MKAAHNEAVEQVERVLSDCKCFEHCNIGGVEPDLTCACNGNPLTIIEVETPNSLGRTHTKKQFMLMNEFAKENSDRLAVVVVEKEGMCGIPLNAEGELLLRERNISQCP
jgi:hypothetical protein